MSNQQQSMDYWSIVLQMLNNCEIQPSEDLQASDLITSINGFDSLAFEALLLQIEGVVQQKLSIGDIMSLKTLQDVVDYLNTTP